MNIQWYPGHMVKTKREIQENVKKVDLVIEILDARIPVSSRNPDLDKLIGAKPKLVLLNKSDLADPRLNSQWIKYYKSIGINAIEVDSITGKNIQKVFSIAKSMVKEKLDRKAERGIVGKPVRALVAGIPNVGKSSFINRVSSKSNAKTGDKPGVTRSKQWIKVNSDFELMDTPGILWPKFDDEQVALHLAYVRSIKDEIIDSQELAFNFVKEIAEIRPQVLKERYKLSELCEDTVKLIEMIGAKRGCMLSGGRVDTLRASNIILDDYRSGKLGKITLEAPSME